MTNVIKFTTDHKGHGDDEYRVWVCNCGYARMWICEDGTVRCPECGTIHGEHDFSFTENRID